MGHLDTQFRYLLEKDNGYTLFRAEDTKAWIFFTCIVVSLIFVDNFVWHRHPEACTMKAAVMSTLFYIGCAGCFCLWVYYMYSAEKAFMWASGYMLEWMLSFDNLFVFHMIFSVYECPKHLKHRPLYLGICGAVFFRLGFIFMGEFLMHALQLVHLVFGCFLIYTGFKTVAVDDDDDDPSQQPLVLWLQSKVRFVSVYDLRGAFFVRVAVDSGGNPVLPPTRVGAAALGERTPLVDEDEEGNKEPKYSTIDFAAEPVPQAGGASRTQVRATMLFLVVICLELSDLLFAVDSVSAIVASVNDLFMAYSSTVFAMLGLRATFFVIDALVSMFTLLKYGVGAVLVFIGGKLITSRLYHVPPGVVCLLIVSAISLSIVASYLKAIGLWFPAAKVSEEAGDEKAATAKVA
eukprot:NODE_727_length_1390_cov_355.256180.p1 GENE.NODE_727_length_1390_cov_355.256180~~NODE_727_length_1390_cov_355.256180.p1  ORF type:complete len:405 (+),score=162.65 NODE_727_length_1390_cov_355.256180:3-1217(+)